MARRRRFDSFFALARPPSLAKEFPEVNRPLSSLTVAPLRQGQDGRVDDKPGLDIDDEAGSFDGDKPVETVEEDRGDLDPIGDQVVEISSQRGDPFGRDLIEDDVVNSW